MSSTTRKKVNATVTEVQPVSDTNANLDAGPEAAPDRTTIEQMIAEAAYYKAAERDFDGGDPVSDWLQAETEIDQRIKTMTP